MFKPAALILPLSLLCGCIVNPAPQKPQPQAQTTPEPPPSPSRPIPTLEQEAAAQAQRAVEALQRKYNITIEPVPGAAPSWWPVGAAAAAGIGRAQSPSLDTAYQSALKQASGSTRGQVAHAAYARLTTGDYVIWVQSKDAPAPVLATPTPSAPTPSTPKPTTTPPPALTSAPTDADAPTWFNTTAKELDGRVQACASADAPTVREAPRMATDAAREALAQATGHPITDLRLESTFVKKVGANYRAYVLVSTPGTMKK